MTDFDKLIKEKAEQAEYSYKPSAWRQFQRKSGLGHAATRYWVVGITSAIMVGGIVGYVGYRHGHGTQTDNNAPIVSVADTMTSQSAAATEESETFVVTNTDHAVSAPAQTSVHNKPVQTKSETSGEATPVVTSTTKKVTTPRYGRPLVIDVDTIKENVPSDEELRNGNSRLF